MTKILYEDILNDMNPKEILSLFGHADQYNEFYDLYKNSNPEIAFMNKEYIFEKILKMKNVDLINLALIFEPKYQARAYSFLRELDDIEFTFKFIYGVDFDWNPYFEYLKGIEILDLNILWNKVVRKKELNIKNMFELLNNEKFLILRIMYFMNLGVKFKISGINIVNYELGLCCPANEVKNIDKNFYECRIINLGKKHKGCIDSYENLQISFTDGIEDGNPNILKQDSCKKN